MCFSPSDHTASSAPQRHRVHVAPHRDAQYDVVPAADAQVSIAASETFGYQPGTYGNRFRQDCLRRSSPPQSPGPAARRPRAQRRAQQDVVVGPLLDEGLVVVEVLAGGPVQVES